MKFQRNVTRLAKIHFSAEFVSAFTFYRLICRRDLDLDCKMLIKHEALNDNNNINISLDAPDAYFISRLGENPEVNIYLTQIEERLAVRHSDGQQ